MALNPRQTHNEATLSDFSVEIINKGPAIWSKALPIRKVSKRADKYYIYDRANAFQVPDDTLGPNALPNEITWGLSSTNYSVEDHGNADWVPQETIDNADTPLQPLQDSTRQINRVLDNDQEVRAAAVVFAAGNYDSDHKVTLTGNDQWSNYSTSTTASDRSNPIEDIQTALYAIDNLEDAIIIFGALPWKTFRSHPQIVQAIAGSNPLGGIASEQQVSNLFDGVRVAVGRMKYNSAKPGQTASLDDIWGDFCAVLNAPSNPGVRTPTFGVTFIETNRMVTLDYDKKRGVKGSHYVKVSWNSDEAVIAPTCGYLISDTIA